MAPGRLKPGWKILGGVAVVVAAWFGGPRLLRRLEFFRVRRIEIAGARYLAPRTITRALALGRDASVFDDLAGMERRLRALPGVRAAGLGRRLPGTLIVTVTETEPVALIPRRGALTPVDDRGRVLPYDPAQVVPDLPIATSADSGLTRVLATVRTTDPALFSQIASAARVKDDVVLDLDGRRVWFTANATVEDVRAVTAVAQDLARRERSYRELDGRFAGQVIVRWAGA
ncbi:MAG TPA: FtsQ-type POTRA domain-containing protein [Gemmatimonadales bacterium]|nr:FtsQ-type POTRA domain-containing protein [Gemmatimonadales bacterium]